ncbi:MAG: SpoIID/LytB domain-containing protein [Acidobacteriota bacterium]|nr:SpoIID/LytB domain-containing protein [Acidobacteriota bacterium]
MTVRVGLATDLESVQLPCCTGSVGARIGGRRVELVSPIRIEPAADAAGSAYFRLQVSALKDEVQAQALARRLASRWGLPADARFDAAADLYKVRIGRFATREEAERQDRALEAGGVAGAWVVTEGGGLERPALRVFQGQNEYREEGRWLAVEAEEAEQSQGRGFEPSVTFEGRRFRGRLLIYLNDRGRLNVINELSLEDYLRGVVPKEMGPLVYPELDALKAQAVAARTYTVRNLGEFTAEGYDLCATPRCHVYGGMDAEHPVTDRAIRETAGQIVLYHQETADTLYTATCGGHTEDVEAIFPTLINRPYLRAVRCSEAGAQALAGGVTGGTPFPSGFTRVLLPVDPQLDSRTALEKRLRELAHLAGLPAAEDRLASIQRQEVQRFVASIFDLALDAQLFVDPHDIPYLLSNPPDSWGEQALRQAAYLVASGLFDEDLEGELDEAEVERMLLQLAVMLHVVREEPAGFLRLDGQTVEVRQDGKVRGYPLPGQLPGFRQREERIVAGDLSLVPGDRLRLYLRGDRLLALVQEMDPDGVAYDRRSKRRAWTRFHTDGELAEKVEERYPGLGFRNFEIIERGASGRVTRLSLLGADGRRVEVAGLAIRWTLGLPETLFTATRLRPKDGPAGWLFKGRGWGHGVGMCQEGAYGMALRGYTYRQILAHYYTGTHLGQLDPATLATAASVAGR